MAQSGYTPILIYASGTATNVPLAANMTSSASGAELALNYADGKLYYKNSSGVVTLLASSTTVTNSFSAGTTGFTPSTATTGAVTLGGTLITSNGGTGLASYTAGDLSYYASGTALTKLAIGTAGQFLTSTGTAPQWSTLSGVAVTTFSAGTTGFTPNTATSGAITLAGTLATTNGGTGLTSFTSGGVVYASSTSALATGSALTFDGTNPSTTGSWKSTNETAFIAQPSTTTLGAYGQYTNAGGTAYIGLNNSTGGTFGGAAYGLVYYHGGAYPHTWYISGAEQMRLTSTGLGIGTSSPSTKLHINNASATATYLRAENTNGYALFGVDSSGNAYAGAETNDAFGLVTNGTYRLYIQAAGNVGIGNSSPTGKLDVTGRTFIRASGADQVLTLVNQSGGDGSITATGTSTTMNYGFSTYSTSNALYIENGGNVGIGTTSPTSISGYTTLEVNGNTSGSILDMAQGDVMKGRLVAVSAGFTIETSAGIPIGFSPAGVEAGRFTGSQFLVGTTTTSGGEVARFQTASGNTLVGIIAATNGGSYLNFGDTSDANVGFIGYDHTSNYMAFRTNGAEAMRIDSSGYLRVNTTQAGNYTIRSLFDGLSEEGIGLQTTASVGNMMRFLNSSEVTVGQITTTSTTTSFVTSSDYRLKNTIAPMTGALAKVSLLKPVTYKWNADGSDGEGFIAHELAEVCPYAVSGKKDALDAEGKPSYQGIDTSFLVATLTAALQELNAKFDAYVASHP